MTERLIATITHPFTSSGLLRATESCPKTSYNDSCVALTMIKMLKNKLASQS